MTVIGREQEFKTLQLKIRKFLTDKTNSTVFISGVPGSGKTHTVKEVLKSLNQDYIYVNCGHLISKIRVYKEIYSKISCNKEITGDNLNSIRNHFVNCSVPHILIIDEIDLLNTRKQNFFYNLTDLVYLENSKIFLICISNTMNLPEKFLESKVCSRIGKNRVDFKPYTHTKLKRIISGTYKDVKDHDLELISRRVASIYGDVRKAFNMVNNISSNENTSNVNNNTDNKPTTCNDNSVNTSNKNIETFKRNKTTNCFAVPLTHQILPHLSKYQKILLYVLCNTQDYTPCTIYRNVEWACKTRSLLQVEFYDFINLLEEFSALGVIKFKSYIDKIILLQDVEEITKILKDDKEFSNIM